MFFPTSQFRSQNFPFDLGWADLSGANLSGANLTGARLLFTDLTGANLKDAVGLEEDQVDEAVRDDGTILPEGVG